MQGSTTSEHNPRRLILRNHQSPGDIVMLTAAVRDLHKAYPGQVLIDVRTPCPALWEHNPHLTALREEDEGVEVIECEYPLIHNSNSGPWHFIHAFHHFLEERLGLRMQPAEFRGDIHLGEEETRWISQVTEMTGEDTPFWIIVAGGKNDYTIKWWDSDRYQRVVDHFQGKILFVQVGESGHNHSPLRGVLDLRGKTDLRQLVRLVYHAQGVLCPVTSLMHLAAAVPVRPGRAKNRACVVVAGGREPMQWEAYPHHQYIHTNGALSCCDDGGCWKSRTVPIGDGDGKDRPENLCVQPVHVNAMAASKNSRKTVGGDNQGHYLPKCMDMITAQEVIRRIELYFTGGACRHLTPGEARAANRAQKRQNAEPQL
jgi:ADP-heptose:LPS heptosyltransferase